MADQRPLSLECESIRKHASRKKLHRLYELQGELKSTLAVTWPDNGMSKKQTKRDEVPAEADTDPLADKQRLRAEEAPASKHDRCPTIGAHTSS